MSKIKDQASALALFRDASLRHAKATEEGDYRTANKAYKDLAAVKSYLQEHGSIAALEALLEEDNEGIRIWTATFLLPVAESRSLAVLQALADRPGPRRFDAEMTLREWKAGRLS